MFSNKYTMKMCWNMSVCCMLYMNQKLSHIDTWVKYNRHTVTYRISVIHIYIYITPSILISQWKIPYIIIDDLWWFTYSKWWFSTLQSMEYLSCRAIELLPSWATNAWHLATPWRLPNWQQGDTAVKVGISIVISVTTIDATILTIQIHTWLWYDK